MNLTEVRHEATGFEASLSVENPTLYSLYQPRKPGLFAMKKLTMANPVCKEWKLATAGGSYNRPAEILNTLPG